MEKLDIIDRQDNLISNLRKFISCLNEKCNIIQSDSISKIEKIDKLHSIDSQLHEFNDKIESLDNDLKSLMNGEITDGFDTDDYDYDIESSLVNIEYVDSNSDSVVDSESLVAVSEYDESDSKCDSLLDSDPDPNLNADGISDIDDSKKFESNDNFRFNMTDDIDNSLEIIDSVSISNSNLNLGNASVSIPSSIPSPTKLTTRKIASIDESIGINGSTTISDNTKSLNITPHNHLTSDIEIIEDPMEINEFTTTSTQTKSASKDSAITGVSQDANMTRLGNNDKSWTLIDDDVLELNPILSDKQLDNLPSENVHNHVGTPIHTNNNGNANTTTNSSSNNSFSASSIKLTKIEPIYKWTKELYFHLINSFHLKNFRSNQLTAINSTLAGKDVFVLMPTGGGKSLCYQLPAIIKSGVTQGTTIVISPLISLMQDQVENLLSLNIKACMFNSKLSQDQRMTIQRIFKNGDLNLIYISPEMISTSKTCQNIIESLYRIGRLSRIVIDEAHCVSNWGHDFRPDYKKLNFFKVKYPSIPIIALTATANNNVQNDIINNLKLRSPVILKQSFNRNNLFYQILPKDKNTLGIIIHCINNVFKNETGIIYCHSKLSCEKLAKLLQDAKIRCAYYHAGMDSNERLIVQRKWQNDQIKVIIATIAFGMGIDKSNVRFVFHYTVPRTLENYYQETGRAGRDGRFSYCITFFSIGDIRKLQKMIQRDRSLDKTNKLRHLDKLQEVMTYCDEKLGCRRKLVLNYFSEKFDIMDCHNNCDNCFKRSIISHSNHNDREESAENSIQEIEKDITAFTKKIVQLVKSIQDQRVTTSYCQDIFKGSNMAKILELNHHLLPEHGLGKDLNKGDIEKIFFYLITLRILQEYSVTNKMGFATNYIKLGPNVRQLQHAGYAVKLKFFKQSKKRQTTNANNNNTNNNLFENLEFIKSLKQRNLLNVQRPNSKDNGTIQTVDNFDTSQISTFQIDPNEIQENERIIQEIKQHHLFAVTETVTRKRKSPSSTDKPKRKFKRRRRRYSKSAATSYKRK